MNNDNTLIPNYRFPEFKNDGSWNKLKVEEIIMNESSSLSINKLEFLDNGYKLFGADGLVGYIDSYKQKDDYIAIVKDGSGAGRLSYYPAYSSVVGTLTYLKIKDKKLNDLKFQYYNLHNIDFKNHIKGGGIPHIYYSDYKNDLIGNPTNPSEQQKTAACLSSLDDVIAGHEEKLTLLEEHKKGLMQNLFPQEGETQPKYRFPEFENDGDWVEKTIANITTKVSDGIHTTPIYNDDGKYYFINGNNLINNKIVFDINTKRVSENEYLKHKKDLGSGTILLSINGTIGNIAFYSDEKVLLGKSACYINCDESKVLKIFLANQIKTNRVLTFFNSQLTGAVIKNLSLKTIKETIIYLPANIEEQQKIATVLSSVDELIVAQREKIETLKEHKKGLMQGLFPKIES